MDSLIARMMSASFGHTALSDAFQGGREAAQSAKAQLPEGKFVLAVALGPNSSEVQDFVEGVRLVVGDAGLIGLPSQSVLTSEVFLPDGKLVCLMQPENMHIALAAKHRHDASPLQSLTSVFSQHRKARGNATHQFEHRGVILIDNSSMESPDEFLQHAMVESGVDGWVLLIRPMNSLPLPLFCKDLVMNRGLIGIEILSQSPVGLGSVSLGSFEQSPILVKEAVKAAVREAGAHHHGPIGLAFFLFDFDVDHHVAAELQMELKQPGSPLKDIPWVALRVNAHGVKYPLQSGRVQKQSVTAVFLPS